MSWIKKLFCNKAETKKCNIHVVSISLSFKEQMKQYLIPRILRIVEKEEEHLNWLIDNKAPEGMIKKSRDCLIHYRKRHKEYVGYVADCH